MTRDERWMREAITHAREAYAEGDRPFGCVVVKPGNGRDLDDIPIGRGRGSATEDDPTKHSEMDAIREAFTYRNIVRGVKDLILYSTHEPCPMCCGAILHAGISRVVYGSARADFPELFREKKVGVHGRLWDTTHPPMITGGVMRDECCGLFRQELLDASLNVNSSHGGWDL